jgi:hypothetical protein
LLVGLLRSCLTLRRHSLSPAPTVLNPIFIFNGF